LFALPPGDRIDTTKVTAYATVEGTGNWTSNNVVGQGTAIGNSIGKAVVVVYDETHVRLMATWVDSGTGVNGVSGSGALPTTRSSLLSAFEFRVPIKGWTSGNLTAASASLSAPVHFFPYRT